MAKLLHSEDVICEPILTEASWAKMEERSTPSVWHLEQTRCRSRRLWRICSR